MQPDNQNRILVVKVGTSTLTDADGRLDRSFLIDFTSQLAAQRQQGWNVILVTSGAIRAGQETLDRRSVRNGRPGANEASPDPESEVQTSLPYKQAAAAIGQGRLMHTYTEAFAWRNIDCAQVLLTRDDVLDSRRLENARNTLRMLLSLGVIPIINENDTVAVDEIRFGDNDNLAALVATVIQADLLLILSDVEGLYAGEFRGDSSLSSDSNTVSKPIPVVNCIDETIQALAGDTTGTLGTGGMRTKVEAARLATEAGIRTVIARGRRPDVVSEVTCGMAVGTTFLPKERLAQ